MGTAIEKHHTFKGIAGLKVIAALFMFLWHSPITHPPVDLGARLCEFFFVTSGFLFAISNIPKSDSLSFPTAVSYMHRKLVHMWPVHFVGFVAAVFLLPRDTLFLPQTLINAILNLTLLQSWVNSEYVFFGFNGVSWYLSSLLFCYLFGFFLLYLMRKGKQLYHVFLFAVVFIIRYALEAIPVYYPGQFWTINAHVSPLVRALEFGLGMITASFFLTFPATLKNRITFVVSTLLEISSLVMIVVILIQMEGRWLRAAYVIPFCILIACFAFDGGLISKLFAVKPIQWLSNFQLEIYMLHQLCFRYVEYRYPLPVQMAIYTCALIMAIFVYRAFLQKILEQILSGVQGKLARHQTSTQISKD